MTDSNKGLCILIVEDNPGDQYIITELLDASVIKIQLLTTAETLGNAVELLQKKTFDIILLDLSLPDSSGISTFMTIKNIAGKTPVIILSGLTDMNIAVEAISHGAQDYHIKGELDEKTLTKTILYSIERKRKLENLREENERYITISKAELDFMQSEDITRRIISSALDAIVCIDIYGKITVWNPQAEKIFGWKQYEILGKTLTETIMPVENHEMYDKGMKHYLATGEGSILNKLIEFTALNREGQCFPVELSIVPLTEGGNRFFCAFIRDMSIRKKAEENILKSEEQYRDIVDNITDLICTHDLDGRILSANKAAEKLIGHKFDPQENLNIKDILTSDTENMFDEYIAGIQKNGHVHGLMKVQTFSGGVRIWEYNNTLKTTGVEFPVVRGYARDVTEQRRYETTLKASESNLRQVLSSSAENFYVIDRNCFITLLNESAEKNLSKAWGKPVTVGTNILDAIPGEKAGSVKNSLERVFAGEKIEYEIHQSIDGLPEWVLVNYMPVSDDSGTIIGAYIVTKDISKRKKAELALTESEERYRSLVEQASDGILVTDLEGNILDLNSRLCSMFGYSMEEAFQKDVTFFLDPENLKRQPLRFNQLRGDHSLLLERRGIHKNGTFFDIELSTRLIGDNKTLSIIRNISERKRTEKLIKESEERYKALVENAPEALVVFDVENGKFVSVSETAVKLFKMSREELLKIGPVEVSPERQPNGRFSAEMAMEKITETIGGGKPSFEWTHCDKEGRLIPCEVWLVRLPSETQTLIRGSIIDIAVRKKAELALKKSEERYRSIIEQATDFIMITDQLGNFIDANSNFNKTFGYTKEELLELNINKVIDPEQLKIRPVKFDLLLKGETVLNERRMMDRNGAFIDVEANVKMLPDGRIMAIARDIRDRKKTEAKLKEQEEQLRLFVEHSPASLAMLDKDMRYIIVSKRWMTDYNLGDRQIIGKTHYEVFPGIPQRWKDIHQRCLAGAIEKSDKDSFTRADGSVDWVRWEIHPWYKALGEVGGIIMLTEVISERVKAEKELTNERNLLRALIDHLPDYIYVKDISLNYSISNRAFVKLVGAGSEEENTRKNSIDLFGEEIGQINMEEDKRILKTGETVIDRDEPIVTRNGEKLWLLTTKVPLKDQEEKVIGILGISKDITERKEAERIIKESEEKYRTMIEQAPDGVFISNQDSLLIDVNTAGCIMMGYTKEELLTKKYTELITPENLKNNPIRFEDLHTGKIVLSERPVIRKDGSEILVEINAKLRSDGAIQSFIRDITDRKKIEQAVKESEEKYRTLVEQAEDAIALYDASGKILDVNTGSVNLLGYTKEELMKMYLSDVLTKEDLKAKPVQYDVLQKGESTIKQRIMRKKDGSVVQTEVRSQQLPDGRFLSVIRDLTERVKAQDLILKEKELSNEIIDSIPGVFFLRTKDKFLRWNKQFEKITGYSSEEITGLEPVIPFYDENDRESIYGSLNKLFTEGSAILEATPRTKGGKKTPFYFNARIITYEGQQCMICTGIDISDRKKAEQELEESYKAIRKLTGHLQNIREEERAHIAREIHDELGQQLTVLKMDISWINKKIGIKDEPVNARMKELLVMLDETVKSVRRISSELRPSLLDDLGLTAAMEWQLTEFGKRFEIKTYFKPDDAEIKLPESMKTGLFRIFQESLTNVARHSKAKKVTVTLHMEDGSIVLSVADNGVGFDKQNTIGKKTLGILGMQERTSMMGGTYEISGKPGKGTRVVATIPLVDGNKN